VDKSDLEEKSLSTDYADYSDEKTGNQKLETRDQKLETTNQKPQTRHHFSADWTVYGTSLVLFRLTIKAG